MQDRAKGEKETNLIWAYSGLIEMVMLKIWHLCTSSESNLRDRILGEVGRISSRVWMWELDHKEAWAPKNWFFANCVLEKTLESPLDSKEIKPVNSKGNQSWIFIESTDAEAEAPIFWSPDAKSQLIGKDADAGKDWRQEEKRVTEDEMVGWHHRISGHKFAQTQSDSEGQRSLVCCRPWDHKEWDTT